MPSRSSARSGCASSRRRSPEGEIVASLSHTGCEKSTLLRIVRVLTSCQKLKLIFGLLTIILFAAGFFASLLVLAASGALLTMTAVRLRWRQRQQRTDIIEAAYRVIRKEP